MKERNQEAKG